MPDRHVIPVTGGWHVERDRSQRISAVTAARAEAIRRAGDFVAREGGGRVMVHDADGALLETLTILGPATLTPTDAVVPHPRAPEPDPARVGTTAGGSPDVTGPARRRLPGENTAPVRRAGRAAAREADRERRAGDARARAASTDDALRDDALHDVVADLLEEAPDLLEEPEGIDLVELEALARDDTTGHGTAADRAGRQVRRVTEQAAAPVDEIARQLLGAAAHIVGVVNPLRIVGRAVEAVVTTGLSVTALVVGRDRGGPGDVDTPDREHGPPEH